MEEYKSNSHKSKAKEEKEIKKVITSDVERKKKTGFQKFANDFVSEDIDNVKSYVWSEIILPNVKDIIFNSLRTAFEMFIYGNDNHYSRNKQRGERSRIYYDRIYDDRDYREKNSRSRGKTGYNFDDIMIPNYGEAQEILDQMDEIIDVYGIASVADYYGFAGVTANHMDRRYGWDDISSAKIVRTRNGKYYIKLPRACLIDED